MIDGRPLFASCMGWGLLTLLWRWEWFRLNYLCASPTIGLYFSSSACVSFHLCVSLHTVCGHVAIRMKGVEHHEEKHLVFLLLFHLYISHFLNSFLIFLSLWFAAQTINCSWKRPVQELNPGLIPRVSESRRHSGPSPGSISWPSGPQSWTWTDAGLLRVFQNVSTNPNPYICCSTWSIFHFTVNKSVPEA